MDLARCTGSITPRWAADRRDSSPYSCNGKCLARSEASLGKMAARASGVRLLRRRRQACWRPPGSEVTPPRASQCPRADARSAAVWPHLSLVSIPQRSTKMRASWPLLRNTAKCSGVRPSSSCQCPCGRLSSAACCTMAPARAMSPASAARCTDVTPRASWILTSPKEKSISLSKSSASVLQAACFRSAVKPARKPCFKDTPSGKASSSYGILSNGPLCTSADPRTFLRRHSTAFV
mmetsp:Transcript_110471/g.219625  ORF Transcript_110471/g.219625 Transcript_110471/m.219625 type:complete len:236 (-) Transcript_110471:495-1202(-)